MCLSRGDGSCLGYLGYLLNLNTARCNFRGVFWVAGMTCHGAGGGMGKNYANLVNYGYNGL